MNENVATQTLDTNTASELEIVSSQYGIDWPKPLQHTKGLSGFMGDIDIYFDFDWKEVILHPHKKFKHCGDLAGCARRDCRGKRPALLLTDRDEIYATIIESDAQRTVVVNIHRLRSAQSVTHFYAGSTDVPLTDLPAIERQLSSLTRLLDERPDLVSQVQQIVSQVDPGHTDKRASIKDAINILQNLTSIGESDAAELLTLLNFRVQIPRVLDGLLDELLEVEHIVRWVQSNPHRLRTLNEQIGPTGGEFVRSIGDVIAYFRSQSNIRSDDIEQVLQVLPQSDEAVLEYLRKNMPLVKRLAENEYTESDLQAVRFRREQLEVFRQLLNDSEFFQSKRTEWKAHTRERVWQLFFESNHWIFGYGLAYVFMTAVDADRLEQPTTGNTFDHAGKRPDALMKTTGELSHLCFVEIKLHDAPLLKQIKTPHRKEVWAIDDEVTGGIIQLQQTIANAVRARAPEVKMEDDIGNPTGEEISLNQPVGFLLVGDQREFKTPKGTNWQKSRCFQLFRRNVISPVVLTYDELFERAKYIVEHNKAGNVEPSRCEVQSDAGCGCHDHAVLDVAVRAGDDPVS